MNGRFGLRNSDTIFIYVDSTITVPLCFSTVQAGEYYASTLVCGFIVDLINVDLIMLDLIMCI